MSDRWVDVSHEALIRGWPRLKRWIEEDRAGLRVHRRLTEAALEWDKMGRDNSLLYRGARLAQATEWRQTKEASLNDLERAFLDASTALERQETKARERLRRRVIGGLSMALAIFVILAGLALLQWRQADQRGQVALARQLAAQADLLRDQPEMLSRRLSLATEAMRRLHAVGAHSLEIDATLRRELGFSPRHVARFPVTVKGPDNAVNLSPDGQTVISGDFSECAASVWEIATRREVTHIEATSERELTATTLGHEQVRLQIEGTGDSEIAGLSANGKYMVTVNSDGREDVVQVWEVVNGRELLRLRLKMRGDNYYTLSNDGRYLAASTSISHSATSTYSESITRVWEVKTQREIPGSAPGRVIGFSQDATLVATSRGLWEIAGGLKERLAWNAEASSMAISLDGGYVAIDFTGEGDIKVWSTATKQETDSIPDVKGLPLALTSDAKRVIIYTGDDEIQTRNVSTSALVSRAKVTPGALALTPSGQELIATVSVDENAVDVWELRPLGGSVVAVEHGRREDIVAVGLTPLGYLTTISRRGKLISRTWDINTGEEKPELAMEIAGLDAAFAPDGVSFAVPGYSGVEVHKVGDPQSMTELAYEGYVAAVAWSPDGRYLAASTEREARVWDLSNHQLGRSARNPGTADRARPCERRRLVRCRRRLGKDDAVWGDLHCDAVERLERQRAEELPARRGAVIPRGHAMCFGHSIPGDSKFGDPGDEERCIRLQTQVGW